MRMREGSLQPKQWGWGVAGLGRLGEGWWARWEETFCLQLSSDINLSLTESHSASLLRANKMGVWGGVGGWSVLHLKKKGQVIYK